MKRDWTDRFWSKVEKTADGCWLWKAATNDGGYGVFNVEGKMKRAHRLAYELLVGPIPADKVLHHACDRPGCIRPNAEHVRVASQSENVRLGLRRKARPTHCPQGHAYAGSNLYVWKGRRFCRRCRNGAASASKARRVAA